MTTATQAPEVFDNLIEARGEHLGTQITMSEPAEEFPGDNAQGVIAQMSFEKIGMRARAFGDRCYKLTAARNS